MGSDSVSGVPRALGAVRRRRVEHDLVLGQRELLELAFQFQDITVPAGAQRLVVVLTWDEPAASAGASQAVTYDLDLWWIDNWRTATSRPRAPAESGLVNSGIDNVEYIVVNNPPPGVYRLKVSPASGRRASRCRSAWPPWSSSATRPRP